MTAAVRNGMAQVLDEIRAAVLNASGAPDMGAWTGSTTWEAMILDGTVADLITRIIRHILALGGYASSTLTYARQHIESVWSRLKDWPTEAWTEVSAVLADGISEGLDSRGLRERVGDALHITPRTRQLESEMAALYDRIEEGVSPAEESAMRSRIRVLAKDADTQRRMWEWRADRIARTETAGAVNAGVDAFARESETATGRQWHKKWWSSQDERVRATHRAAHGQIVPPGGLFIVGGATLRYPGDPTGPAREVINCRCHTLLLTAKEAARL